MSARSTWRDNLILKVTGYRDGLELCVTLRHGLGNSGHLGTDGTVGGVFYVTTYKKIGQSSHTEVCMS